MPTCKCGKTVKDWRGARGHVQFSTGDGHGENGEVPDGWKDLFEQDDDQDDEQDADDGGTDDDAAEAHLEDEPDEGDGGRPDQADGGGGGDSRSDGRLRRALFDDFRALWGGDE